MELADQVNKIGTEAKKIDCNGGAVPFANAIVRTNEHSVPSTRSEH